MSPEGAASEPPQPSLSAPLQPPNLLAPPIGGHRALVGGPIRLVKRILHRLLAPVVLVPQAEFNLRVAARLNQFASTGERPHSLEDLADSVAELRGEVLAIRAELQSAQVLLGKIGNASTAEVGDGAGTGGA